MSDLNDVKLYGRVVKNAELKKTANNKTVAVFSVAYNYGIKKEDGSWDNKADFFPLAIYGDYAERLLPKLVKGQKVIIEGYLKQNKWEKNNIKHSETAIGVRKIQVIMDSKKEPDSSNVEENETFEFTEEQLAEMYNTDSERISGAENE